MKSGLPCVIALLWAAPATAGLTFPVVDTGQTRCYDSHVEIRYPTQRELFFGQDAQYEGHQPAYRDNGDGTVTDLNTGLMWESAPGSKKTFAQAVAGAKRCRTGGYTDWRLPTIKEMYSLILFSGTDPDPRARDTGRETPFIDTRFFKFEYGKASDGERVIDSQWATSTRYVGSVMHGASAMFGVNFADGRIKGYPTDAMPGRGAKQFYVIYVRGNPDYGRNNFADNGDGTITDRATGLTWMKVDSAALRAGPRHDGTLNWAQALEWAEQLHYAGRSDWRLPNAKELQSIVDYTRSPDTTRSAAIDPVFEATPIVNEGGETDYAYYWTGTSHTRTHSAAAAVYIAFGRALGFMSFPHSRSGEKTLMDVHGAGAQRSDEKSGDPSRHPQGRGPQGDVMRIYNLVRCVRGGTAHPRAVGPEVAMKPFRRGPDTSGGPGGGPAGFVAHLDRNGDGRVSRREFDGPSHQFAWLDANHDGYLTESEAPPPPSAHTR